MTTHGASHSTQTDPVDFSQIVDLAAEKLASKAAASLDPDNDGDASGEDLTEEQKKLRAKLHNKSKAKKEPAKEEAADEASEDPKEEAAETPDAEAVEESGETEDDKKKKPVAKGILGSPADNIPPGIPNIPLSVETVHHTGLLEPEEVDYRMSTGARNCATCKYFIESGRPCMRVDFPIDPNYTCNLYERAGLKSLSMVITKASVHNGERRWAATASDTDPDQHGEACSPELFKGFMDFFEQADPKPFLGVAHYPRMKGKGVAGTVDAIYMDGKKFKAKGTFADNPLGDALFNAVANDRMSDREDKIRISLAWWDLAHTHGNNIFSRKSLSDVCKQCVSGNKIDTYTSGYLDHLAATRVPVNNRTELSLEMKSMAITRKADAASIVDEILANQLEADLNGAQPQKALVIRSNTGLPPEAYALVPDKTKSETWKVQIWENETAKVTPAQLVKAADALKQLSDTEKAEAVKVLRSEYRTLGVKPHQWPETIRPDFPAVPSDWNSFSEGLLKLASDADTAPYVAGYALQFKSKAFKEIEPDLLALEGMVEELSQKSEIGENMDDIQLNPNDPYEAELLRFKSDVDDIKASDKTPTEKAAALKAQFGKLGDVYVKTYLAETKSEAMAPVVDTDALTNAFSAAIAPLAQQIALLSERMTQAPAPAVQGTPEPPPTRKSVAYSTKSAVEQPQRQLSQVDQIARRSVGLQ